MVLSEQKMFSPKQGFQILGKLIFVEGLRQIKIGISFFIYFLISPLSVIIVQCMYRDEVGSKVSSDISYKGSFAASTSPGDSYDIWFFVLDLQRLNERNEVFIFLSVFYQDI